MKKKTVKIASMSGTPTPDLRVVTPADYYNFVEFVSHATCVLLLSKKNKKTTIFVVFLLLPHFCTYFSLQTQRFLLTGTQECFCPRAQGTLAT